MARWFRSGTMRRVATGLDALPSTVDFMSVHTLRIESTADDNRIELRSAARWARGPGCTLRFSVVGGDGDYRLLEIDDRVVRFGRREDVMAQSAPESAGERRWILEVQVATTDDMLTLNTEKSGRGTLSVSSDVDHRHNERQSDERVPATLVLFLRPLSDDRAPGDEPPNRP